MWNANDNDGVRDASFGDNEATINVNGESIAVEPGTDFVEKIIEVARDYGIGKFKVVLNGREIDNEDAPSVFEEEDVVTLVKFEDPA
jgi:hypothetical protein